LASAVAASQRVHAAGLLRMNLPLSFGTRFIAPLMPEFSRRHPAVHIDLGLSDAALDWLAGNWDLAIRIGHMADSPMQVCAAPDYLDRRGVPRRVAELIQHNCLSYMLSAKQGRQHWSFGPGSEHRVPFSADLMASNGDALLAAAVRGQDIIYQPQFIAGEAVACGERLVLALDRPPVALGGVPVIYPPERRPPAKVRAMIGYLAEVFEQGPLAAGEPG
jgi:DNA-binding transcriptional LysR family regulator